jgi:drug/metabolite transporter (DMT)-like permease
MSGTSGPTTAAADRESVRDPTTSLLLVFVLASFAANSLITRHVVAADLLDAGLLSAVRFVSGAIALVLIAAARRERIVVGRANLRPALWLGVYAVCISYGYQHIGAAAGTFVFYATVLLTLVMWDVLHGDSIPLRRAVGAAISLAGIAVLASGSIRTVTVLGVLLLAVTGAAWGLYTAAGRTRNDPRVATTGHFVVLAAVLAFPALVGVVGGLHVTSAGIAWAIAMGAGTTALAYVAWYACQRSLSGTTAGAVQLVIPVLTAIGAALLLGEQLTARLGVCAALVVVGTWLGRPAAPAAAEIDPRPGTSEASADVETA